MATRVSECAGLHSSTSMEMAVVTVRQFRPEDAPVVWTLNSLPNVGETADEGVPLPLPASSTAPPEFPDLADIPGCFLAAGGDFLVAELDGSLVGMAGLRPSAAGHAEVLRVRVHPALRTRGIGRALMDAVERRAAELGFTEMVLDTAQNQPEAIAFYRALGYVETGRETQPSWTWTLVYFTKALPRVSSG